jgi:type I restriction enzyme S subunit
MVANSMNVLLSIKPIYVDEILAGKKIFEFRKSIFKKKDISKVFIYSSSPVKKIVASFEIARIIADSPKNLWSKFQNYGGISENDFFEYFKNSDIGYAIEITNLNEFSEPINPYKLKKNFKPPQSYCYLPLDYFENKSINSISRIKNHDMVISESDNDYLTNLGDNNNTSKTQKQTKFFTEARSQKMNELSEELLKNSIIIEEKIGWAETELSQVAEIVMGQSPPSSTYNEKGIGLPFFQGKAEFTELHPIVSKWCSQPNKIAEANDILISVRAPVGATNIANQRCCIGRGLAAIRYPDCNKYVFYFLRLIEKELDKKGTGTTFKAISGSVLKSERIPFPPLPEQRAIVSKIELLFSELDNGIANLKLAQEQLKVYRQAVLKKAFEGELTKKWRGQQTDLPDAGDLLELIRREREEAAKTTGKKLKQVRSLTEDGLEDLNRLPNEWHWVKIGEITLGVGYGTSAKSKESGDAAVLRMGNIQNGRFDWNDLVYTSDKTEIEKYLLSKDDVLFNRTNSPELVGKTATYKGERAAIFAGYLIRVNQLPTLVVADYLNYFLNCPIAKIHGNSVKTDGVNQSNINGEKLGNYPFPLCSISEQQAIIQEIETRLSVCDKIEQDIETNLEKAEALRQSILKKAFEGKLLNERELAEVRGAEDWEPAEVLLDKIRVERAENGKK